MSGTQDCVAAPVGVLLAGGRGRRLGGAKPCAPLAGRPLLAWSLAALRAVLEDVVVAAKPASVLPPLPRGVEVWLEPSEPSHPLVGVCAALQRSPRRAVLVCAVDLPLVTPALIAQLVAAAPGAPAVVASAAGRLQPLLARYGPGALPGLLRSPPDAPLIVSVRALQPVLLEVDRSLLLNVNTREDLTRAERALARRALHPLPSRR